VELYPKINGWGFNDLLVCYTTHAFSKSQPMIFLLAFHNQIHCMFCLVTSQQELEYKLEFLYVYVNKNQNLMLCNSLYFVECYDLSL
jgi:hypothetical protein